jgi:lysophospholipase L1-like esterase
MPVERLLIVGLGDSTTAGTPAYRSPREAPPDGQGDPESQYAHWMMEAHPDWTVLNRGIDGQTAAEIRGRFEQDVLRAKPAYVILLAGVNDIFGGSEAESVERELARMYADALDAAIVPVAASVLPYDRATPRATAAIFTLNTWIESFAKVLDIPFADTHAAVAAADAPHRLRGSPDGMHPDVDGYRRMGAALSLTVEGHLARHKSR